jgi:flagellar biosynthesis/type III secretory pathway protein FliH
MELDSDSFTRDLEMMIMAEEKKAAATAYARGLHDGIMQGLMMAQQKIFEYENRIKANTFTDLNLW